MVGASLHHLVKHVFENPKEVQGINNTLIMLISKLDIPQTIRDFRPISLCNVAYKVIMNIVTNRLKKIMPIVISPNQGSFVPAVKALTILSWFRKLLIL